MKVKERSIFLSYTLTKEEQKCLVGGSGPVVVVKPPPPPPVPTPIPQVL